MSSKGAYSSTEELAKKVNVARGEEPATVVVRDVCFLDVLGGSFVKGDVAMFGDTIVGVRDRYEGETIVDAHGTFLVPGFIDSHVHIESSLLVPHQFEAAVLPEGTTTVIWDPHEIANVCGVGGIEWALAASEGLKLDVRVMVPSCVPSTSPSMALETSGAVLSPSDLTPFRGHPRVLGLAEMMNYPGLLFGDREVHQKIADWHSKIRDGHCPGLSGKDLNAYGVAGISTCHESTAIEEAQEKLTKGIHVWIREGSCAKDATTLLPLVNAYTSSVLGLCSDDRNPLDIAHEGHINAIINKGLKAGLRPEDIFRVASFGPARLYGLADRGVIAPGYKADLVLLKPVRDHEWTSGVQILGVWKNGTPVKRSQLGKGQTQKPRVHGAKRARNVNLDHISPSDLRLTGAGGSAKVIGIRPGQIFTDTLTHNVSSSAAFNGDTTADVLKIAVFERHNRTGSRSVALVKGMGLKTGAIATSINHDSHNCIVVGSSDQAMTSALNKLIDLDGGIVVASDDGGTECLALPIGGLMTDQPPAAVTECLKRLKALAKKIGCPLEEPFLQLSFLALPVIPSIKITDRGLVDVTTFKITSVFEESSL